MNTVQKKRRQQLIWLKRNPLKLTALLYLREALNEERYEDCPGLIGFARQWGACEYEIQNLLEDSRRIPKP
ncbi:MAG: hypothetical protein JW893_01485 [Candidatus Omnitrophica bacterium]|nr:hypothetical protein [Candidatus Omnitrophota bacterium]